MSWAPRRVPPVRRWPGLAALAAAAALLAALGAPPAVADGDAVGRSGLVRLPPVPDDPVPTDPGTIVGLRGSGDVTGVAKVLRVAGLRVQALPRIDALFMPRAGADAVRRLLSGDGRVRWIEPTRDRTLLEEPSTALDVTTGRAFDWAYDAVGAGAAIAAVGGGSPASVAVVDSGVDATHPDLAGRVAPGRDIAFGQSVPADLVGHGTFVAGLISAVDGNGIGTRGVAGATTVVPIRVTTTGSITSANAAAGIVAAVDAGASVVNLSFGGPSLSAAERAALDYADAHDVLVVAAAGNTRSSGNAALYPAASIGGTRGGWSEGISVGAVDPTGAPAPFSTSNDAVTLSAPGAGSWEDCGDGVFSTIPRSATLWTQEGCLRTTTAPDGTRYGYAEGTSFAAPIVAGGAALVRAANPRLTAAQTADVLRRTARQTVGGGWNSRTGAGVVDLAAAVAAARRYDVTPPVPSIVATPSASGVSVAVTVRDATSWYAADRASVTTVRLEGSSDGVTYAPVVADGTGALRVTDRAAPGTRRWYRAAACDANRNCGSATAGPVTSGAGGTSSGGAFLTAGRPALAAVSAQRPRSCGTCVRIAFTARGRGPLRWSADIAGAGIRLHRAGRFGASGRRTVAVRLPRLPYCGGRMTVVLRLRSSLGQAKASRNVRVAGGRCRRSHGSRRQHRE